MTDKPDHPAPYVAPTTPPEATNDDLGEDQAMLRLNVFASLIDGDVEGEPSNFVPIPIAGVETISMDTETTEAVVKLTVSFKANEIMQHLLKTKGQDGQG